MINVRNHTAALKILTLVCLFLNCSFFTVQADEDIYGDDGEYKRAVEDEDNVKEKLFPKKGRIELNIPDVGVILNTSFVYTYLVHLGLTYYSSETFGWGLEGTMGINNDKGERTCLESFYNDPKNKVAEECGDGSTLDNSNSNYGPAYMPVREINSIIAANAVWNPVYGKQLLLLSSTSFFDVFVTMGGGAVMSDYYEQRNTLNNGKKPRAVYNEKNSDPNSAECKDKQSRGEQCEALDGGADTNETDSYGIAGRPEPISQTHPFINLGIGQRYHFWRRFNVKFEFRDMILIGTPGGFENYFAIWGGFGVRF